MTAPEPWRERPARPTPPTCRDPSEPAGDSEFSWGPGLVPRRYNGLSPSENGIYMPRCPRVDPPVSGIGPPRQVRRPPGEARGFPGEVVAR